MALCPHCRHGIVTGEPYDGAATSAETWPCPECHGTGIIPNRSPPTLQNEELVDKMNGLVDADDTNQP